VVHSFDEVSRQSPQSLPLYHGIDSGDANQLRLSRDQVRVGRMPGGDDGPTEIRGVSEPRIDGEVAHPLGEPAEVQASDAALPRDEPAPAWRTPV